MASSNKASLPAFSSSSSSSSSSSPLTSRNKASGQALARHSPDNFQSLHDSSATSSATFPRHIRPSFVRSGSDAFTSPIEHLSPSSPWSHSPNTAANTVPVGSSPIVHGPSELSAFYSNGSGESNSANMTKLSEPSASTLFGHYRQYSTDDASSAQLRNETNAYDDDRKEYMDDGESLFNQRDPLLLPRRNHTIASGAAAHRRRLDQHFHQASATSPSKNSLSAITGGKEDADDDWEAIMKRKEDLILPDDEESEEVSAGPSNWPKLDAQAHNTSSFGSSHRRFPSQPTSTFGTSPVERRMQAIDRNVGGSAHQRSESADLIGRLDQGPFASSPIVPGSAFGSSTGGIVRRHQSLNYHSGRQLASRLHGQHQDIYKGGIDAHGSNKASGYGSPIIHQQSGPEQAKTSPRLSPIGDDSGLVRAQSYSDRTRGLRSRTQPQRSPDHTTQLASSLMDMHAQLAQMSIGTVNADIPASNSYTSVSSPQDASKPKLPSLITNRDTLALAAASQDDSDSDGNAIGAAGPFSASAYVPPIGHAHHRRGSSSASSPYVFKPKNEGFAGQFGGVSAHRNRTAAIPADTANASGLRGPQTALPTGAGRWQARETLLGEHRSGSGHDAHTPTQASVESSHTPTGNGLMRSPMVPSMYDAHQAGQMGTQRLYAGNAAIQQQHQSPSAHNNFMDMRRNQPAPALWANMAHAHTAMSSYPAMAMGHSILPSNNLGGNAFVQPHAFQQQVVPASSSQSTDGLLDPNVRALIMAKGYNPPTSVFDTNPSKARFFVIKSFTEDDVQRSLKHEIWASTEKGNQRLDRAFKESSGEGPLYLLFSVNASGHFCGIAEMLTPLDYTSDSTVWVQEGKWKGTFKVRWIYVKDVPNNKLRHIRLTNTTECKPITQSRDTQELPADGGRQALKIIAEFASRTTLLQDWTFYEKQQQQSNDQVTLPAIKSNSHIANNAALTHVRNDGSSGSKYSG